MTLREMIKLIDTDEYTIVLGDTYEEINAYEKGSFKAIRKYFDYTVEKIIPLYHSIEIRLK